MTISTTSAKRTCHPITGAGRVSEGRMSCSIAVGRSIHRQVDDPRPVPLVFEPADSFPHDIHFQAVRARCLRRDHGQGDHLLTAGRKCWVERAPRVVPLEQLSVRRLHVVGQADIPSEIDRHFVHDAHRNRDTLAACRLDRFGSRLDGGAHQQRGLRSRGQSPRRRSLEVD